jgi:glutamate dehydrogenase
LPESDLLRPHLLAYFPKKLRTLYPHFIEAHPLKRELIATGEANLIVNRLGPSALFELTRLTGASLPTLIELFAAIRSLFELDLYWKRIDSLDGRVLPAVQHQLLSFIGDFSEETMRWVLRHPSLSLLKEKDSLKQSIRALKKEIEEGKDFPSSPLSASLKAQGVPVEEIAAFRTLSFLKDAPQILLLAQETNKAFKEILSVFCEIETRLSLSYIYRLLEEGGGEAAQISKKDSYLLKEEIKEAHFLLTHCVLKENASFQTFLLKGRAYKGDALEAVLGEIKNARGVDRRLLMNFIEKVGDLLT